MLDIWAQTPGARMKASVVFICFCGLCLHVSVSVFGVFMCVRVVGVCGRWGGEGAAVVCVAVVRAYMSLWFVFICRRGGGRVHLVW